MELGLTRKEVNSILFHYDADDDGNITYSEFVPFAFDLLAKLTEMRIFETEMAHDELAQFLVDLFKAKETELGAPAGPGKSHALYVTMHHRHPDGGNVSTGQKTHTPLARCTFGNYRK